MILTSYLFLYFSQRLHCLVKIQKVQKIFLTKKKEKKKASYYIIKQNILVTSPKSLITYEWIIIDWKYLFFYFKLIFSGVFKLFWCVDVKNNFKKIKNIYYFNAFLNKNNLKNNHNHTLKHPLTQISISTNKNNFFLKKKGELFGPTNMFFKC
jgi:hypothetical protein